jgi:hypothetical protein
MFEANKSLPRAGYQKPLAYCVVVLVRLKLLGRFLAHIVGGIVHGASHAVLLSQLLFLLAVGEESGAKPLLPASCR